MNWILGMAMFLGGLSLGTEILSVDFKPELHYRDIERACQFAPQVRLFNLTAELEDGKVVKARLKKNSKYSKVDALDLDENEMRAIFTQSMTKEPKPLIERFEASERMLRFFFYEAFIVESPCIPKGTILDFAPVTAIFEYRLPDPTTDPMMYDDLPSNVVVFKGHNDKQQLFRIDFSLTQAE